MSYAYCKSCKGREELCEKLRHAWILCSETPEHWHCGHCGRFKEESVVVT